jgi:serine phosphatase RsbU (regulator of sigma subunit)
MVTVTLPTNVLVEALEFTLLRVPRVVGGAPLLEASHPRAGFHRVDMNELAHQFQAQVSCRRSVEENVISWNEDSRARRLGIDAWRIVARVSPRKVVDAESLSAIRAPEREFRHGRKLYP